MEWIERIERQEGRLVPIYVDDQGVRAPGSLAAARLRLPRTGYKMADIARLNLAILQREDATRYLEGLGMQSVAPSGHDVFSFQHGDDCVLVPAATLMTGLIGRLSAVGERLLEGASLPRVAIPTVVDGTLRIRFARKIRMTAGADAETIQRRFAWLTSYPSARRMWSSVHVHAMQGRLNLTLPLAHVDVAIAGHRLGNLVLVTRFNVKTVYPDEAPLPFAVPYIQPPFDILEDNGGTARLQRYWKSATTNAAITKEYDIPVGSAGYATTEEEWLAVIRAMKDAGYIVKPRSKSHIDAALEKFGNGRTWASMGGSPAVRQATHRRWVSEGRWAALKTILHQLR